MQDIETVVVVAAGEGPSSIPGLPPGAAVIAADGGLQRALALGLRPSLVVGDLDSADPEAVREIEGAGVRVARHPVAKDATDLELALDEAVQSGARRIVVVASAGGRLDHLLAVLLLLGSEKLAGVEVDAHVGEARIHVVRSTRTFRGQPGDLVTLIAVHGPAERVTTDGLAYPLRGEALEPGSSRGVSNVLVGVEATVTVGHGVVLAIRPGGR